MKERLNKRALKWEFALANRRPIVFRQTLAGGVSQLRVAGRHGPRHRPLPGRERAARRHHPGASRIHRTHDSVSGDRRQRRAHQLHAGQPVRGRRLRARSLRRRAAPRGRADGPVAAFARARSPGRRRGQPALPRRQHTVRDGLPDAQPVHEHRERLPGSQARAGSRRRLFVHRRAAAPAAQPAHLSRPLPGAHEAVGAQTVRLGTAGLRGARRDRRRTGRELRHTPEP